MQTAGAGGAASRASVIAGHAYACKTNVRRTLVPYAYTYCLEHALNRGSLVALPKLVALWAGTAYCRLSVYLHTKPGENALYLRYEQRKRIIADATA